MSIIKSGEVVELLVFILTAAAALYYLWSAMRGKTQELRKMSQVDAISDAVDKAVEEGKPIFLFSGFHTVLEH